ncbi:hypothetical protein CFC21_056624 [Triticum aestivum]|uniref:Bifunctional inhibitor/plant lipid transfer protein/seed storage helical domain-containing protein n=3 Tax=Triticum TaxID=4564 RepID=A0A9R0SVF6_TRITD|nr:hypothetical protein CFC21_056624 [Triticum aestivum]VAI02224.1 unnamed protein product [Triticum turgidum subsp. durum]
MAFMSQLIPSAAVLLAVLAATSATIGTQCVPGSDIPYNPLQACRNLLSIKICSVSPVYVSAGMLKRRCCDQLSRVPAYCRCEALRILVDGVETPEGAFEGGLLQEIPRLPKVYEEVHHGPRRPGRVQLRDHPWRRQPALPHSDHRWSGGVTLKIARS